MIPEIIARVDAWIDAQFEAKTMPRGCADLVGEWVDLRRNLRPGPDVPPGRSASLTGILLALVREACGDRGLYARQVGRRGAVVWAVYSFATGDQAHGVGDTEALALVACLEAASQ